MVPNSRTLFLSFITGYKKPMPLFVVYPLIKEKEVSSNWEPTRYLFIKQKMIFNDWLTSHNELIILTTFILNLSIKEKQEYKYH